MIKHNSKTFLLIIVLSAISGLVISFNDSINKGRPSKNSYNILYSLYELSLLILDPLQFVNKLKSINNVKQNYIFVLTDGIFEQNEINYIQDYVCFCEKSCLEEFGIGLDYYYFFL